MRINEQGSAGRGTWSSSLALRTSQMPHIHQRLLADPWIRQAREAVRSTLGGCFSSVECGVFRMAQSGMAAATRHLRHVLAVCMHAVCG